MDRSTFENSCRDEGYTDIQEREGEAGHVSSPHTHPFAVRGLVLGGEFTLDRGGDVQTYREGETFAMDADCEHAESFGAAGAQYVIARRHPSA